MRLLPITILVVALPAAWPAVAQTNKTYCSEPVTPFCASRSGVFEDDRASDRCRDEVRDFAAGMREYIDCLGKQREEAAERIKLIEERFACMARGDDNCP
jgi:hypothetical protein